MKRSFGLFLLLLILLMPQAYAAPNEYLLRQGDVLSIKVFGQPELSFPAPGNPDFITIRPDGCFAYPFAGEVKAEGLSPQGLAQLIYTLLSKYYVDPGVTVNVIRFSTERVYVLGEVNAPGQYELDKSRNLMDAIGAAKGWTKDAAKTKVFIIHKDQKGEPSRINLLELLKRGDMDKNVRLQEGDIVYLTENHRINITNDILPWTQIYYNLKTVGVFGRQTDQ